MERGNGGRRLLAWDAPNMDMCLSEVIGSRASTSSRPNLAAVYAWLAERAHPGDVIEACVFCNVPPGYEATMTPWVVSLRHMGFAVFAKPKRTKTDDVDPDIARHIERRFTHGPLVELVVASHDAKAFAGPLRRYAKAGVPVLVLGYREKDTFAHSSPEIMFVDMEDIPGAFERPLPRTNLFDLPSGGRWFDPFPPAPDRAPAGSRASAADRRSLESGADLPERDQVVDFVESEVRAAAERGLQGLGLREVGDLLRAHFPSSLRELGFAGVSDLVDAIERPGRLRLSRVEEGFHVVSLRVLIDDAARAGAQPRGTEPAEGQRAESDSWANGAAGVESTPAPGAEPAAGPSDAAAALVDNRQDAPSTEEELTREYAANGDASEAAHNGSPVSDAVEPTEEELTAAEPTTDEPVGAEPAGAEPVGDAAPPEAPTPDEPTPDEPTPDERTPLAAVAETGDIPSSELEPHPEPAAEGGAEGYRRQDAQPNDSQDVEPNGSQDVEPN
ncbi:MAG: putative heme uptake system protein, partial [Acidimicrobiia bacterium]|nr:putative heme uptake system protein [Acidimicrobiia bacterium]